VFNSKLGPALVTSEGWKVRYQKTTGGYQLYYLPDDYEEANDLIKMNPEKLMELKEKLLSECGGVIAPKEPFLPPLDF
jgi:hypothetical protein